ncbi:MAG: phytanoyl-CoA dioxygenase family protein [Acidobacteriota bacterium]|nr:phytanoyl-CoA dioxygenase family protein [Acidobacteriota bacterium]
MRFLCEEAPSFERFEQWVLDANGGSIPPERIARLNAALAGEPPQAHEALEPALSPTDLAFFAEHGYVVLHDAVPPATCAQAAQAIWSAVGADPALPETWYRGPQGHSIWVPLLRHPALAAARQSTRITAAFAQLWGRSDLWPVIDQTGFNPPERGSWRFPGPHLHWDVSLASPIPFGLQGILYLTATEPGQGAFTCVPGFHRRIEEWLAALPEDADPRAVDLRPFEPVPIPGRAGDLIIWHHALPHGSSPNRASLPRIVQYLTLRPTTWPYARTWR